MTFDPNRFAYRSMNARGTETAFVDIGEGDPVLLIHGSGAGVTAVANWWATIGPLATRRRVIAVELAGFGRSGSMPDDAYSISAWVEQLVAFLDALGVETTDIVGNSLGAWLAIRMAQQHANRIRRMVLMGAGGAPAPPDSVLAQHRQYEPDRDRMRDLLRDFVVDPDVVPDALVEHRYEMSRSPEAVRRYGATSAARSHDRVESPLTERDLRHIDHATLLVHGREDRVIPPAWSEKLSSWLPNSDLLLLSKCGHWSQIERAELFNPLVLAFLDREADRR